MGELPNHVSNGPDSFFEGKAVTLEGRDNSHCCFITCGRGMVRNGKVSHGNFQLDSYANKKSILAITQQPTCLLGGRQ